MHRIAKALSAEVVDTQIASAEEMSAAGQASQRRPRRKAQLHGTVTVFRPAPQSALETANTLAPPAASSSPAVASPGLTNSLGLVARNLEWPRYPKLLAQIRALELEAEQLRQREAAAAIQWIKIAIRTYGIKASELELSR